MTKRLKDSSDWTLAEAIEIVREIKEHAALKYGWDLQKNDIEEVISLMDYNNDSSSADRAQLYAGDTIEEYWQICKEHAAQQLWLSKIKEEVERKDRNKNSKDQAL